MRANETAPIKSENELFYPPIFIIAFTKYGLKGIIIFMKRIICILICLVLLLFTCGCSKQENTVNRILFDTAVTLTARCEKEILLDAIKLCEEYEALLSRTKEGSDLWRINNAQGEVNVSEETAYIIRTALEYCEKTAGKYDITITPVSSLWDFGNEVIPSRLELEDAVKKVDYKRVKINGNSVDSGGTKIDLGSAAKGYIADKLKEFFEQKGVSDAIINLGGNVYVIGNRYNKVGVASPFESGVCGVIKMSNASAVTSGVYQRCFEKNGTLYHHFLDTSTGYSLNTDLLSVTVVGESSLLCDILSTACMVSGMDGAKKLLEEAKLGGVLIPKEGNIQTVGSISFSNE